VQSKQDKLTESKNLTNVGGIHSWSASLMGDWVEIYL